MFIAITNADRSTVQILCPAQPDWGCTVSEGAAGLQQALWVPAQHTLITIPDFSLHTSVWHVHSGSSQALPGAKHLCGSIVFGQGSAGAGQWAALLSREHGKDTVHWYDTVKTVSPGSDSAQDALWSSPHEQSATVAVGTQDAAKLLMAPHGHSVWVIDDPLHAYAEEWAMDGTCLHKLSLRVAGLGIAQASAHISAAGGLLVLPTHSGPVHVINALSHDTLLVANEPRTSSVLSCTETDVFVEVASGCEDTACCDILSSPDTKKRTSALQLEVWRQRTLSANQGSDSRFVCASVDLQPRQLLPSVINESSPPSLGATTHCSTSADEGLLALVCASRPSTVCVYETAGGSAATPVAALCLRGDVSGMAWDPESSRLLVATASSNVLVWEPGRAYAIQSRMGRAQAAVVRSIVPPPAPAAPWLLASRGRWCTARMTSGLNATELEDSGGASA